MEIYRFPFNLGKAQKLLFYIWVFIRFIINPKKGDTVYTINPRNYLAGFILKKVFNCKWVIDGVHSPYFLTERVGAQKPFIIKVYYKIIVFIYRVILKEVDLSLAMAHSENEGFARLFKNEFNVSQNKIVVIPGGVDLDYVNRIMAGRENKKSSSDEFINMIYVGTINKNKFVWALPHLEWLAKNNPGMRLLIIGSPERLIEKKYNDWVARNYSWIRYYKFMDNEGAILKISEADLCLCILDGNIIDYNYSHPVKIFEYMALKKCLIAPRLEGISGIIKDGENGLLYEWNSPEDFIEKVGLSIRHPEIRARLGERAGKDIIRFDWKKLNEKVIEAFETLRNQNL
jgi:glycosyltransferase involved in cell wall biosynthesis